MEFFDVINNRYSYKQNFRSETIPMEHLEKIADAGLKAPTGNNSQCVSLIILDREALDGLCRVVSSPGLATAPAAIILFTDPSVQQGSVNFEVEDYAASTEAMLLAAVSYGYVSVWLDAIFFDSAIQKDAKKELGIPDHCHLRVALPIGFPEKEEKRRPKKAFEERESYNKFGISKSGD